MNSRTFIRNHITAVSIIIYIAVFCLVQAIKPAFLYNDDGSLKQFGPWCPSKNRHSHLAHYSDFSYF